MAAAYVFVRLMPELHSVHETFVAAVSTPLRGRIVNGVHLWSHHHEQRRNGIGVRKGWTILTFMVGGVVYGLVLLPLR